MISTQSECSQPHHSPTHTITHINRHSHWDKHSHPHTVHLTLVASTVALSSLFLPAPTAAATAAASSAPVSPYATVSELYGSAVKNRSIWQNVKVSVQLAVFKGTHWKTAQTELAQTHLAKLNAARASQSVSLSSDHPSSTSIAEHRLALKADKRWQN